MTTSKQSLWVAVDVETTGLGRFGTPPRDDAIIEIGIATQLPGNPVVSSVGILCNPGLQYLSGHRADAALAINGITISEIAHARPIDDVAEIVARLFETYVELYDVAVVAFNASFDLGFISSSPFRAAFVGLPWYCAQSEAADAMDVVARPSLIAALSWAGLDNARPHRAQSDAVACLQLWATLEPDWAQHRIAL